MHRTGHWLGMDVHDCGSYVEPSEVGNGSERRDPLSGEVIVNRPSRILRPGMVLTIEPGLYVSPAPDVPRERYPLLGERYRHHYMAQQGRLSLFEGVLPMLHSLHERGHVLTVATGKSRRGLDEALQSVELQGRFQGSRTADETAGKPHPRMLEELMAEFGVAPERTLMVGDTTHDLQMALNAGCASVAVSYGAHEPQGLHALGPRAVVHTVDELQRWLLSHA
jgi:phosphoglycolate phosphatase